MTARTYTGWKAGLLVVFATVVVTSAVHLTIQAVRDVDRTPPDKVVTTVTPTR